MPASSATANSAAGVLIARRCAPTRRTTSLLDRLHSSPSSPTLADGDIDEAVKLADRILTLDKANRVARTGGRRPRTSSRRNTPPRKSTSNQSIRGPITDLVATLLSGWATYGAGDCQDPRVANIDKLTAPGMVSDLQGPARRHESSNSRTRIRTPAAASSAPTSLMIPCCAFPMPMRAGCRAQGHGGRQTGIYEVFEKKLPRHPLVQESMRELIGRQEAAAADRNRAGRCPAERCTAIGATLTRRGGEDLALVYLQLALYLQPNHALALLSLADLYESVKKPQMAIKVYERMPANSPLKRNAQIPACHQSRRRRPRR